MMGVHKSSYQNPAGWSNAFRKENPFFRIVMSQAPFRVLFVCLGNICRSPAAEIVCRAALREAGLADRVRVDSCGTASYHVGSRPDSRMIAALERAGYEYDGHRARVFCREDGSRFDLIIPQDLENMQDVLATLPPQHAAEVQPMSHWFPAGVRYREVPDPYYGAAADFDEVVELLRGSMAQLVAELADKMNTGKM